MMYNLCNINLLHLFLYAAEIKYSCLLFHNYFKTFLYLLLKGLISFSFFAVQVVKDVISDNLLGLRVSSLILPWDMN